MSLPPFTQPPNITDSGAKTFWKELSALLAFVNALESAVSALVGRISALESRVAALQSALNTATARPIAPVDKVPTPTPLIPTGSFVPTGSASGSTGGGTVPSGSGGGPIVIITPPTGSSDGGTQGPISTGRPVDTGPGGPIGDQPTELI